jgi:hypothetical protein
MHTRTKLLSIFLAIFLCCSRIIVAQDADTASKQPAAPKPPAAYKLDFSINELEDGKKINTRHFSMSLMGMRRDLKIGTRMPIATEQGKFQYIDVGISISALLSTSEPPLVLDVSVEISSLPAPTEGTGSSAIPPLLREAHIAATTIIIPDKPAIVGSVEDPGSRRQFQLEVLATKLK